MRIPFEIVGCSWPRPVEVVDGGWVSEPEWEAPLMPTRPLPCWRIFDEQPCWTIDWREFFKSGTKPYHESLGGEMRRFHVVSHLRIKESGKLAFWTDDGCVIARNREGNTLRSGRSPADPGRDRCPARGGVAGSPVAEWRGLAVGRAAGRSGAGAPPEDAGRSGAFLPWRGSGASQTPGRSAAEDVLGRCRARSHHSGALQHDSERIRTFQGDPVR